MDQIELKFCQNDKIEQPLRDFGFKTHPKNLVATFAKKFAKNNDPIYNIILHFHFLEIPLYNR